MVYPDPVPTPQPTIHRIQQEPAAAAPPPAPIRPLVEPEATSMFDSTPAAPEQPSSAASFDDANAFGGETGAQSPRVPTQDELDKPAFLRRTMD